MTPGTFSIAFLLASGIYLSWSDLARRRLPNIATGMVALAGLGGSLATGGLDALGSHGLHLAVALAIGFGLFALGTIGSGDAKYYAAVAAWFPLGKGVQLLGAVSIAGFVVALVWLVKSLKSRPQQTPQSDFAKVPFGIAIATGSVFAAVGTLA